MAKNFLCILHLFNKSESSPCERGEYPRLLVARAGTITLNTFCLIPLGHVCRLVAKKLFRHQTLTPQDLVC